MCSIYAEDTHLLLCFKYDTCRIERYYYYYYYADADADDRDDST